MSIQVAKSAATETPLISLGKGAEIDDIWSTDDVDSEKPMSCGIFVQKKDDEPFEYTYGYHEVKIILEGTITLEDRSQGIKIVAKAGDVLKIAKGTTVTFSSESSGRAFYTGQRKLRDF
ncbi:hypothetical protein P389DRAFT_173435 [Cystobasidium minutum MCA 4210]|uniref:uncharacterized protein n=1 Tax=Cystobasidium minutum MCA 4210 TaxID=1397322 RepID=UPI0034CF60ED|eukprot:jgi/Rhomi1/173435/fgenesh1_kg.6_\